MSRVAFAGIAAIVLSIAATPADAGWRKKGWSYAPAPIVAVPMIAPQVVVPVAPAPVVAFTPAPVIQQIVIAPTATLTPAYAWSGQAQIVATMPVVTAAPPIIAPQTVVAPAPAIIASGPTVVSPAPIAVAPAMVAPAPMAVAPVTLGWVSTRPNCGVYGYWNGATCLDARFDPPVLIRD